MDYLRNPTPQGMQIAEVLGFTSTIFGATAAIGIVRGFDVETTADALGIAAAITPVNSYRTWMDKVPNSSIKYSMPGPVAQAALTAAYSAEHGHSGSRQILDDAEFGYRRFIGSARWEPEHLVSELGSSWGFPGSHSYKPYPHCRVGHGPFDALYEILEGQDIRPEEIDAIRCWGEGWVEQPVWLNTRVERPHEAQFSIRDGLAVAAHRIPPGNQWQTPETLRCPSVLALMEKVTFAPHPDYLSAVSGDLSARPTTVEVDARDRTFSASRSRPKGTPSDDPELYLTTGDLVEKFRANVTGVVSEDRVAELVDGLLTLEKVDDVRPLIRATAGEPVEG